MEIKWFIKCYLNLQYNEFEDIKDIFLSQSLGKIIYFKKSQINKVNIRWKIDILKKGSWSTANNAVIE